MAYFIIIAVMIKKYTEFTISKIPTFIIEIFLPYNIMARMTLGIKNKRAPRINSKYDDR